MTRHEPLPATQGLPEHIPHEVFESLPDPSWSILTILRRRYAKEPNVDAFHAVDFDAAGQLTASSCTMAELIDHVEYAASRLAARGVTAGDRVVITLEDTSLFLAYFLGALTLGAIAAPLPSITSMTVPSAHRVRILAVCDDCAPRVIVGEHPEAYRKLGLDKVIGTYVDAREQKDVAPLPPDAMNWTPDLEDVAYLQYTSGSTGTPRGVVVTHGNLVANLRGIVLGAHFTPRDTSICWLPLFHDMGLIGGPLLWFFVGSAPYVMTPTQFITRPHMWLHGITKWRATFTVAPNFAYALAAYKIPEPLLKGVDLSSMRLALNGSEPINHKTIDAFLSRYEPYGFQRRALFPVYGLAEAVVAVSFPVPGHDVRVDRVVREDIVRRERATPYTPDEGMPMHLVSVGSALPEHEVVIRSLDDRSVLPERHLGEVCVRGASVSPKYFGDEGPARDELATGDLGYLAEGDLFIVDRIKDLVIIAGQNFSPSDIERYVGEVPGVRQGRVVAYSAPGEQGTEELHIIAEVSPLSLEPFDVMRYGMRSVLREKLGLIPSTVAFVAAGTLPRTSSGKLRRRKTQHLVESGEISTRDRYDLRVRVMISALLPKAARALARLFRR